MLLTLLLSPCQWQSCENIGLQWHSAETFANLGEDNKLNDVTLACEDCEPLQAHKVILVFSETSKCYSKLLGLWSPLFRNIGCDATVHHLPDYDLLFFANLVNLLRSS